MKSSFFLFSIWLRGEEKFPVEKLQAMIDK
jgi:hypothetical protein